MFPQLAFALFALVASYLISSSMIPAPAQPSPASIDDFTFPQFDEGTPQAVIFGDCWSSTWMILSYGNYRTQNIQSDAGAK